MIAIGPYEFTTTDAVRTLGNLGALWESMMDGRESAAAATLGAGLTSRLRDLLDAPESAGLRELGITAAAALRDSPFLGDVLTDSWNTLRFASDILRAGGQMPPTATGRVVQLGASTGGVPKSPIDEAEVGYAGVVGDRQAHRVHHGRPWQALCIWSDEVIETFRADGHPVHRGAAGENITIGGLPWADVRPGVRLQIGGVAALVQAFAEPCNTNAQWFRGGEFMLMHESRGPVSRVYATVLEPGRIVTGDPVILEP